MSSHQDRLETGDHHGLFAFAGGIRFAFRTEAIGDAHVFRTPAARVGGGDGSEDIGFDEAAVCYGAH